MARDVLRGEKRDGRLIRSMSDGEGQSERGRSRKRLQATSRERREAPISWPMNATKIQARIFLRRTPMELELVSAARTVPIPCRGKDSARADISPLSCNVSAIRTPDCTLAARVRNGERHCRGGRNGERCRNEWRIESDVVVDRRAAKEDITAGRGTRSDVLWKEEEYIRRRREPSLMRRIDESGDR